MSIVDLFERGRSLEPGRPFAIDPEMRISFAEAASLSRRIASALAADNIGPGSSVAVCSPNSALGFVSILGIFRSGAAWVTVNYLDGLDSKIEFLRKTETECLFYHSSVEEDLGALIDGAPSLRRVISIDARGSNPSLVDWAGKFDPLPDFARSLDDEVAVLDGTGGTTGGPKAAMQTHRTLEAMTANLLTAMPVGFEQPVCLIAAPMTHGAGNLAHGLLAVGTTNVLLPRFDPEEVLEAIERYRVTHLFLPPTAIYMLLRHPRVAAFDYSSLRYFVYGGAPMSIDRLKEGIEVFGPVLAQVYGQAEACLICTCLTPADHVLVDLRLEERLWSCGRPALLTPVGIMDDDGHLLPSGERGEIVVRGSLVMKGYYKDPEATSAVSTNGWHRTGDVGYVDEEGFVFVVDRKKEMIISGGFNVYPAEVERVLLSHPAVHEGAVVGAPHEKWGEAVTAVVELKPGAVVREDELIRLCKSVLGSVKAPKRVEFWKELPRSATGKILRREIRAAFWSKSGNRTI